MNKNHRKPYKYIKLSGQLMEILKTPQKWSVWGRSRSTEVVDMVGVTLCYSGNKMWESTVCGKKVKVIVFRQFYAIPAFQSSFFRALCVHCACIMCALCVHYVFVIYALCMHYVCIMCALFVHYVCVVCALCVLCVCFMCALCVLCVCIVCACYLPEHKPTSRYERVQKWHDAFNADPDRKTDIYIYISGPSLNH